MKQNRRRQRSSQPRPHSGSNQIRIIGGQWRGRKLAFPEVEGLRPTPDRVRETLFNWLAPYIPGARCLDLFAGSGALGLEALSRGAATVTWVDNSRAVSNQLQQHLQRLEARGEVICGDASAWLASAGGPFDVVFLDPPFDRDLAGQATAQLARPGLLATAAWVYIETGRDEAEPAVPANWRRHRSGHAGQVQYRLFQVEDSD